MTEFTISNVVAREGWMSDWIWEQKLEALNALVECNLKMRRPGDWYVEQAIEVKDGSFLASACGNGSDPQAAVEEHWKATALAATAERPLVLNAGGPNRRHFTWNGYRWVEHPIRSVL